MTRAAFGRRFTELMAARNWTSADMYKKAGIPRDAVSKYRRGLVLPGRAAAKRMADAFGIDVGDFLPHIVEQTIDKAPVTLEMKAHPDDSSLMWLRVNQLVSTSAALKIAEILTNDKAAHGDGSRTKTEMRRRENSPSTR